MPKGKSSRSVSYERRRSRVSPYSSQGRSSPYSSQGRSCSHRSDKSGVSVESSAISAAAKQTVSFAEKQTVDWEEVRCPVCMDHPHNAVLLICASHEKGCRPFMCDTSYRHSNCLDQYRKACKEFTKDLGTGTAAAAECSEHRQPVILSCPLCRGPVSDWTKDYDARKYMNSKVRACTMENCEFRGAYNQLRKHAREDHPAVRPMEVDPERQRDWHRMEQQRDIGDLFSMLRSGLSGREGAVGITEGGEDISERVLHGQSVTMIFIQYRRNSDEEHPGHRRSMVLFLRDALAGALSGVASGSGDADTTAPDSEEYDDMALSTEASAGSQHDGEVDDDNPAQ